MALSNERRRGGERGSVSIELIGALPIVLLSLLVAAQIVIAGYALWSAGIAAKAGARAVLTGKAPRPAAEHALPGPLRRDLKVTRDDGLKVGVRIPALIPGLPESFVYGTGSLGDG
ncbi:MAG: hypothetical protein JJE13_11710 [Thermoleophilia bacterium]|nr:hypothetical protein [Thermoleophilia bacterium]